MKTNQFKRIQKGKGSLMFFFALVFAFLFLGVGNLNAQITWSEDFTDDDGEIAQGIWTLANGVVSGELVTYTNNFGVPFTDVIWSTSAYPLTCSDNFYIDYSLTDGSGTAQFEYSVNGTDWFAVGLSTDRILGNQVELRLKVTDIPNLANIEFDNVSIREGIMLVVTKLDISCKGETDASISIVANCGEDTNYKYTWTCPAGYSDPPIAGGATTSISGIDVIPGDYTIFVENVALESNTIVVTIVEPGELKFSVDAGYQNWNCADGDANGKFSITITGGNAPYTTTVTNSASDVIPLDNGVDGNDINAYDQLVNDSYSIEVVDDKGCPVVLPLLADRVFVVGTDDGLAPTFVDFPDNYFVPYSELYLGAWAAQVKSIDDAAGTVYPKPGEPVGTVFGPFDCTDYSTVQLQVWAQQSDGTWVDADQLEIQVDYGAGFESVLIDRSVWNGNLIAEGDQDLSGAGTVPSPLIAISGADGQAAVNVKIICTNTDGRTYSIQNLMVYGDHLTEKIPAATTRGLLDCNDDYSCEITNVDGPINYPCSAIDEFYFIRTWIVTDGCTHSFDQDQYVSVGTRPTFVTPPEAVTYDFCHNTATIVSPDLDDNCTIIDEDAAVNWVVTNSGPAVVDPPGVSKTISDFVFPLPEGRDDSIYTITWTITDNAFITNTYTQQVTIKPTILITCVPTDGDKDFCSGETKSFTVTVEGGTGDFVVDPVITPAADGPWGGWTSNGLGGFYGTYTTSNLDLATGEETILISVNDNNIIVLPPGQDVCPSGDFDFTNGTTVDDEFTIHELIITPAISRD
ncbi:MAG: hypothetical protein ACERKD_20705 [Prolixibacteraceae bacterium]